LSDVVLENIVFEIAAEKIKRKNEQEKQQEHQRIIKQIKGS